MKETSISLMKDIVYIIGDIIYNDPPLIMPDGEKYAEPERSLGA